MSWGGNIGEMQQGYWAAKIVLPAEDVEVASGIFYLLGAAGVEWEDGQPATADFVDVPFSPPDPFVRAYFPEDERWNATQSSLLEAVEAHSRWDIEFQQVFPQEWEEEWKRYYQPIELGQGYRIVPSWMTSPVALSHTIWLDPGMAFGTGQHPTTMMCLKAMQWNPVTRRTVLDLGSGSGILAIAAAKRAA
ncbi:MAG: 50S ribosomal protein L11 methyltransferase, partial [Firmicutes bacterium]|nr:50S ribosomal protein L11 methyltransferase [Bacillota bacterium]